MADKRRGRLSNIIVKEVSLVDEPANLRRFMFVKSLDGEGGSESENVEKAFKSLDLSLKTDGTSGGTSVTINGKRLKELKGLVVSMAELGQDDVTVYAQYTIANKGESPGGFESTRTYTLRKSLVDDIEHVKEYADDLPAGLRRSVENILGAVTAETPGEPVEKETPMPDNSQDGQETTKEEPKAEAPQPQSIDPKAIASEVAAQLAGPLAEQVTKDVLAKIEADREAAAEKAAAEEAEHKTKVEAGEELVFANEDEMRAAIAAEAAKEAVEAAGGGG